MATLIMENCCVICRKEKASFNCERCSQIFCSDHIIDHRQQLNKQFEDIQVTCDLFRQKFTERIDDPQKNPLIQRINQWEQDSIKKIQQTAEKTRQIIIKHMIEHKNKIEIKLAKLIDHLQENRKENDFFETELNDWKEELIKLEEDFVKSSNISIEKDSTSLINNIFVQISGQRHFINNISVNTTWKQNGIIIAGGNGKGNRLNQLYYPQGIFIDDDQTIYIADYGNHRIIEWKSNQINGHVLSDGSGRGNQINQLNYPTNVFVEKENDSLFICDYGNRRVMRWSLTNNKIGQIIISNISCYGLTMDNNGYLYVSDTEKNEVRRWKIGDQNGTIVAGGNGKGNRLDQLDCPSYIFIDEDYSLYISDWNNHRVMKWLKEAKEGIVVAGGNGQGTNLAQLFYPCGVMVDQLGRLYVADCNNNRVMRWYQGARQGSFVVGGHGQGERENQFNFLRGLSFDRRGNLYAVDYLNNRIQKFEIDLK